MAQYWEDWSGSTIGSAPTGWTARFVTSGVTYTVQAEADARSPAGRRLRIVTSSTPARRLISANAVDADSGRATFEVAALVKVAALTDNAAGLVLSGRGSGAAASETVAGAGFIRSGTAASRAYNGVSYDAGASAFFGPIDTDGLWTNGEVYWLRVRAEGASFTLTLAEGADPSNVLKSWAGTETQDVTAAGWIGIFTFHKSLTWDVYAVGIGTDGDAAPVHVFLDGAAAVQVSAAGSLTTGAAPVKGISIALHDGSTPQANVTGITAVWWDSADPGAFAAPAYSTTASTDASGVLTLDLDADTALSIGQSGFLVLYKAGAAATDDLVFAGRLTVQDIS